MKKKSKFRWQVVTSTISTTMVLVLLGILVLFVLTAKELRDSVREDLTVTIILNDSINNQDALTLSTKIQNKKYIKRLSYISREDALQEQVETLGIDPREFLGTNPFSISIELHLTANYACSDSLTSVIQDLRQENAIADIIYQKDMMETLNYNLRNITLVLLVITSLLIIVSLSLINNTVRLSVYSRRFIIHTMKLVGAKWNFIRRPFLIRSFWIGLSASVIANATLISGIIWLTNFESELSLYITRNNILIMAGCVCTFGLIITMLCTFISVTHFLNMREEKLFL